MPRFFAALWFVLASSALAQTPVPSPGAPFPAPLPARKLVSYVILAVFPSAPTTSPVVVLERLCRERFPFFRSAARRNTGPDEGTPTPAVFFDSRAPVIDELVQMNPDLHGVESTAVARLPRTVPALIISFHATGADAIRGAREACALLGEFAAATGALLCDTETRGLYSVAEWKQARVESWQGDIPAVGAHIMLHTYESGGLIRIVSLGMLKFGLPEVVAAGVPRNWTTSTANVLNLIAQTLVEGRPPARTGELALSFDAVQHQEMKARLTRSLLPSARRKATVRIAVGKPDEGDPDNLLMELTYAGPDGKPSHPVLSGLLDQLCGTTEEQIRHIQSGAEVDALRVRLKPRIAAIAEVFRKGLAPGARLIVKAPFVDEEHREWMWLEVVAWKGEALEGILLNDAVHMPALKNGARVTAKQAELLDYEYVRPDGTSEGKVSEEALQGEASSPSPSPSPEPAAK